jgi:hypothetical protein
MELHKHDPDRPIRELVDEGFQLLAEGIDPAFGKTVTTKGNR